jgi:hypothetical protein
MPLISELPIEILSLIKENLIHPDYSDYDFGEWFPQSEIKKFVNEERL